MISRRLQSRQRGFTMIELMVSMSVTLVGLAGLLTLYGSTSRANRFSATYSEAAELASSTMEQLQGPTVDQLEVLPSYPGMEAGLASDDSGSFAYSGFPIIQSRGGLAFARQFTMTNIPATSGDLVRLRLEVYWFDNPDITDPEGSPGSDDSRYSVVLETLLAREAVN